MRALEPSDSDKTCAQNLIKALLALQENLKKALTNFATNIFLSAESTTAAVPLALQCTYMVSLVAF